MSVWITWELFEELYNLPAGSFPERCDYERCMIYIERLR